MAKGEVAQAWTNGSSEDISDESVTSSNNEDEGFMFDHDLLRDLDLNCSEASFHPSVSVSEPGEGLRLRPLHQGDYSLGFLQLLGQLTSVGEVSQEMWLRRFHDMRRRSGVYHVMVLEDTDTGQVRRG